MTKPRSPQKLSDVLFAESAIKVFDRHRQRRFWSKEAGGQLFGSVDGAAWSVTEATGVRRNDIRTIFGFRPDRHAERAEIDEYYAKGLHYLGDWHTHPEHLPRPSPTDVDSMQEMVRASQT